MTIDVDPALSHISGRNGCVGIKALKIFNCPERTYIDGISAKKGITVHGGIVIPTKDIPKLRDALTKIIKSQEAADQKKPTEGPNPPISAPAEEQTEIQTEA